MKITDNKVLLDRHHVWRSHDPTFGPVRKLPQVTAGYRSVQVTAGYRRLPPQVTAGYRRLPQVTAGYHRLFKKMQLYHPITVR